MKNVKFYPKRLIIVMIMFLLIPLVAVIARVADIHLPSPEEEQMLNGADEAKQNQKTAKEQEEYYKEWHDSLPKDEKKAVDNQNKENSKKWAEEIKEEKKIYDEYKDKWMEQPPIETDL